MSVRLLAIIQSSFSLSFFLKLSSFDAGIKNDSSPTETRTLDPSAEYLIPESLEEIGTTGATFEDRPLRAASLAAYLACCASRNAAGPDDKGIPFPTDAAAPNDGNFPVINPGTLSLII